MKQRNVLSDDEVQALLAVELETVKAQNRLWFWLRSGFILCYVAAMVGVLLLAPERIFSKFMIPPQLAHVLTHEYAILRMVVVVAMAGLYLVSYFRSWYFPFVALAAVLIAGGNLINDVFTLYVFVKPEYLLSVQFILALRLLIIIFLIMNFLGARKHVRIVEQ